MTVVLRSMANVVVLGGLLSGITGCGPAKATWLQPHSYTYTLHSSEGERAGHGTFRIAVTDGKVVAAKGLDDASRRALKEHPELTALTVGDLLTLAERARSNDWDVVEVRYADGGHPTQIFLDRKQRAIDDEQKYVITNYAPK